MQEINLIFPNQLFESSTLIENNFEVYLIEENLFFNQYKFHKQKIYFHRSSMLKYFDFLNTKNIKANYISSYEPRSDIRTFIAQLNKDIKTINVINPDDNWLEKRLSKSTKSKNIELKFHENKSFITPKSELAPFFRSDKKKLFQTSFYKSQRLKLNILIDESSKPEGGKWTYDDQNREKYPKNKKTPKIIFPSSSENHQEIINYINTYFPENPGDLDEKINYPSDFKSAKKWFDEFLKIRFREFGPYEDAVLKEESILNHSLLSPLLNVGLLSPIYVVNKTMEYYKNHKIPINSCEGFIRQIIGWREFIRGVYHAKGTEERTKNFWGFKRKIPTSFYDGSTGIEPIDDTIKKINQSAYANHIERLMIVGNFMLLCEFDPDEVYRWFMELFIDAYDWVMVPNVYGMSQFADGGIMSTKPYISGSNYILKMSNYKKGEWCGIWDALFWNFMDKQRSFFLKNPRMRMLISSFDKMDSTKKENYLLKADNFLKQL
jgi:deoxyribodipyrimidine photolyase-related protein